MSPVVGDKLLKKIEYGSNSNNKIEEKMSELMKEYFKNTRFVDHQIETYNHFIHFIRQLMGNVIVEENRQKRYDIFYEINLIKRRF